MPEPISYRHGLESFMSSLPPNENANPGVTVRILQQTGHINLRGDSANSEFIAATTEMLGQALPICANTMTSGDHRVYWLGPDEWLIVTPLEDRPGLIERLRKAMAGQHASVTDLSGGQLAMHASGPGTEDVLARGCTLDFHPDRFRVGACAQSGLAKANMLIGLLDNQPTFEIIVRRSFAEYLVLWLRSSAGECGIAFCR